MSGPDAQAATLFEDGLCLPSGSSLRETDQERVIEAIEACRDAALVPQKRFG